MVVDVAVLQCGGLQASLSKENGECGHVSIPTFKSVYKRGGLCEKIDE